MDREQIRAHVTPIFHDIFDDDAIVPHDRLTAEDVADWDSLSNIRLLVAIEQAFDIHFATYEVEQLADVGALLALIERKLPQ